MYEQIEKPIQLKVALGIKNNQNVKGASYDLDTEAMQWQSQEEQAQAI